MTESFGTVGIGRDDAAQRGAVRLGDVDGDALVLFAEDFDELVETDAGLDGDGHVARGVVDDAIEAGERDWNGVCRQRVAEFEGRPTAEGLELTFLSRGVVGEIARQFGLRGGFEAFECFGGGSHGVKVVLCDAVSNWWCVGCHWRLASADVLALENKALAGCQWHSLCHSRVVV